MPKARVLAAVVFLVLECGALFAWLQFGWFAFAVMAIAGCVASNMVFQKLASADERRLDLEERVRNSPN
jgi:hypothetical protein